ncbi:SusD/RagB family nutrient-binding outer membrane lipoprotein [uncultured Pontibacter sp.]|uniref:SusD/RagB family nutrient-binding outer membrane lipoprotein n=1 Tax=uncultured Pontibacter sp. TaxID=453356 RepID=UPI00263288BD|nr:SusD/RagB family nutrient-binding outer membrane lipoprotein [uncultured Pontibacter sp.]
MKKIKLATLALLAATSLSTFSCKKEFEEINTDPNRTAAATPEALLAPALHDMVVRNQNRALRLNNELMQVHVTTIDSDEIHRYVVRPSESDYMWNNWYLQRTNFVDMYSSAEAINNTTFMGIALICDAWVTSLITDMFGDVPYTEANRGREGIYQPRFDAQQDIYVDLFRKLEEANTLLAANQALTADQRSLDPLYQGDITKWRKFGNSLYLRLLMRVSGKPEMNTAAKIQEIVDVNKSNYPIFANNDESAILRFTTTPPMVSAFYTFRDFDFNGSHSLSQFFVNNLNSWNDPRIERWATISGGTYNGIPSGYPVGQVPERQSTYLVGLKNEPLLGNIMNYAELQFILAEAALKGMIANSPETFYNRGVESAITMWQLEVPEGHFENDEVRWEEEASFENKMDRIHVQKYYTLFFTDFQQWHEYRRTGHPILPKGSGLRNNGEMPARFLYPVSVQSLNRANYTAAAAAIGGDDINTKVWWNKN